MNCKEYQKRIDEADQQGYLREDTADHREICQPCRRLQSDRVKLRRMTDNLSAVETPADFDFVLHRRLRERYLANEKPKAFWLSPQIAFSVLSVAVLVGTMFSFVPPFLNSQSSEAVNAIEIDEPKPAAVPTITPLVERNALAFSTPSQTSPSASSGNMAFTSTPRPTAAIPSRNARPTSAREVAEQTITPRRVPSSIEDTLNGKDEEEILVRESSQNAAQNPQMPSGIGVQKRMQPATFWLNFFGVEIGNGWTVNKTANNFENGDKVIFINGTVPDKFEAEEIKSLDVEVLRKGQKVLVKVR